MNEHERNLEPHGGNIYRFMEEFGIKKDEIIDFSASINPLGVPKSVASEIKDNIKYLCNYPDPDAKHLTQAIARHSGVDPQHILCGNGSTELIYLTVRALKPEKVLIPMPTFSEYEQAFKNMHPEGGIKEKISYFVMWEKNSFEINPEKFIAAMSGNDSSATYKSSLATSVDMAFLCNPNNPTSGLLGKEDVLKIAEAAKNLKCYLVVDEAFIDFVPEESVAKEVRNNPYLIVLRSLTKFYALSGMRIGYGVFPSSVLDTINRHKEPWTVNTIAQLAGIAALNDISYRNQTFKVIRNEKRVLEDGFKLLGITYFQSPVNFYLTKHENAPKILASLRSKGILVRDCSNFMGLDGSYMRVAVKSNRDNMRLLKELAHLCRQ
ncbi:MAG: threonine-phosphate decarboxylase CobD [Nitrospirae bacterium]|jgi:threonine-phosphate decarboxylase|nr:threonine-phosphate decarboxylase CobD [Nitrospirota bacterium]MDA8215539.1 threonine-phosphate decarboxylase CobD [Nitrospiraceae bacterium]MDA8337768.1 threonine-phosphate decarboxylase CobD [Nitrospiraceae bacterium]